MKADCILVIDATEGLHNQDLKIAALAWETGRGLIIVVNKWDIAEKETNSAHKFQKECEEKARQLWQEGKPDEYFFRTRKDGMKGGV